MDSLLNCMLEKNWQFCYTYQAGKSIGVNYGNYVGLHHNNYVNDIIINFFLKYRVVAYV